MRAVPADDDRYAQRSEVQDLREEVRQLADNLCLLQVNNGPALQVRMGVISVGGPGSNPVHQTFHRYKQKLMFRTMESIPYTVFAMVIMYITETQ